MTRKIEKPEDAVPHNIYRDEPSGGHGGSVRSNSPSLMFTAAECAQIARAYADIAVRYDAEDIFDAWESKFKEWES